MTIKGTSGDPITLKNILIGEVWVCSGQSNMEMGVGAAKNGREEIAAADYPGIRLFMVTKARARRAGQGRQSDLGRLQPEDAGRRRLGRFLCGRATTSAAICTKN